LIDAKLKQSPASLAFMLRDECRDLLLNSQAAEHDFFLRVAKDVEIATVQICEVMSQLLQGPVLRWSEADLQSFARLGHLEVGALREWRSNVEALSKANEALRCANDRKGEAKTIQSRYSGIMWGAKSGFDSEHAAASKNLALADNHESQCATSQKNASQLAEKTGAMLLDGCVSNAVNLASSKEFGGPIELLLREVANKATVAAAEYRKAQLEHVKAVQQNLSKLKSIYEA